MNLCDIKEIELLLSRHGFHFSKSLGQNFLIDAEIPAEIAERAGITPDMGVLEVGPGIGALSSQLCRRAGKVAAVELDERLPAILKETMAAFDNFTLIEGDILKINIPELCREHFGEMPAIACANLPYYITTPAVTALLESRCFERVVVMLQKEAAERICAMPGDADYSAFTAQMNYYAKPTVLLEVPRKLFLPAPKVDSVVLSFEPYDEPPVFGNKAEIFRVIRAAFANRRKTLANGLNISFGKQLPKKEAEQLLVEMGFEANVRGEVLSLADFAVLAEKLHAYLQD